MVQLRTASLTISPCGADDCADFVALEHDPDVMRFLNGGHADSADRGKLEETFLRPRGTEPHVWTARRGQSGSFVGWFCLWPENDRLAELGYRLRRSEWGQGLASEGALALVNWGFGSADYDKITASTMAVNHVSRRVLKKTGFQHVRTVAADWADAIPGGEMGEVQYELTRQDWVARHGHALTKTDPAILR